MSGREWGGVIVIALGIRGNSGYAQGHVNTGGTRVKFLSLAAYGCFNKDFKRLFPCLWGLSHWGFKSRQDGAVSTYQEGSMFAPSKQIDLKLG